MDGSKQRPPAADLFLVDLNDSLMKRMLLAGTFYLLAGAATLLLAASIFYACRRGGDPHHESSYSPHDTQEEEMHAGMLRQMEPDGMLLTLGPHPFPRESRG